MTSLTAASQCSCGARAGSCSCGSVSKACGCGSMMPAASCCGQTVVNTAVVSTNLPRRGAPPACEPTVTCEAYRYEVFLAPPSSGVTTASPVRGLAGLAATIGGEMFERITCCVQAVLANIPTSPGALNLKDQTSLTAWANFCCNLRLGLIQYVIAQGSTDCQALARLQAISCPSPNNLENFEAALMVALEEELLHSIELLLDCVCSAALPPLLGAGRPAGAAGQRSRKGERLRADLGVRLDAVAQACGHHQNPRLLARLAALRADAARVHAGSLLRNP